MKCAPQPLLRAVDDATVIAEHEAADGGHADDGGDQRQVGIRVAILDQWTLPVCAAACRPVSDSLFSARGVQIWDGMIALPYTINRSISAQANRGDLAQSAKMVAVP